MTTAPALDELPDTFRGRIVTPEDRDYENARTIYNAMIDRRPAAIARCSDVADVLDAVRFAREQRLDVSIRGGGHNGAGLALVDGGLTIDLSELRGIRVDPRRRTARVEGGCLWGDVDHATHAFGLATVSGILSTTGVGGLTLGGGHGYLTRRHGLTVDNLLGADVVLADGRLVHAGPDEHPELFWALRGGGGNFGVVTSFEFRLHPVETVVGGPMFWPLESLPDALRWYRDWLPQAPEEAYAFFLAGAIPAGPPFPEELHGRHVCGLVWCHTGAPKDAERELSRARREVAEPLFEHVGPVPYPALQSMFDGLYPPGDQWYWKGDFVREIPDEAIETHRRHAEVPTPQSTMHLYPVDGAAHRADPGATAWSHRDATWSMVIAGVDPDPEKRDLLRDWARGYREALRPHTLDAAYVNFMMDESDEGRSRVRATYGDAYERLRDVKSTYDPDNLFHVNQNVAPRTDPDA